MRQLGTRVVVVIVVLGVVGASWFGLKALSQEKLKTGTIYIDENGDFQVAGDPPGPERVSLVRLIADRERYDGRKVETQGFFVWAYEDTSLYLSREDAFNGITHNGLVLDGTLRSADPDVDARAIRTKSHLQYVTVSGTFHKQGRGHLGLYYAGKLADLVIQRIERKSENIPLMRMKEVEAAPPVREKIPGSSRDGATEPKPKMGTSPSEPVTHEILRENTAPVPASAYFVVVRKSRTGESTYCLVPPFGRNPFAIGPLEDTSVRLYRSIRDLSKAIRDEPPSVRVDAGNPDFCQPSRYPLRALTRKEFDEIKALLHEPA